MSTFFTLPHYVYFFQAVSLCHPFPFCSTMSTFSTLLRNVYLFHAVHYFYFFHAVALYIRFPRCCDMSTFFHSAQLCLLFSTLLRYVPVQKVLSQHLFVVVTSGALTFTIIYQYEEEGQHSASAFRVRSYGTLLPSNSIQTYNHI